MQLYTIGDHLRIFLWFWFKDKLTWHLNRSWNMSKKITQARRYFINSHIKDLLHQITCLFFYVILQNQLLWGNSRIKEKKAKTTATVLRFILTDNWSHLLGSKLLFLLFYSFTTHWCVKIFPGSAYLWIF